MKFVVSPLEKRGRGVTQAGWFTHRVVGEGKEMCNDEMKLISVVSPKPFSFSPHLELSYSLLSIG